MSVLYLTIFVSVMLAVFFVAGFVYHHLCSGGDPMRDSHPFSGAWSACCSASS
jgi:hypothetical protein